MKKYKKAVSTKSGETQGTLNNNLVKFWSSFGMGNQPLGKPNLPVTPEKTKKHKTLIANGLGEFGHQINARKTVINETSQPATS